MQKHDERWKGGDAYSAGHIGITAARKSVGVKGRRDKQSKNQYQ
jgi:hypothetical protein